MSNPLATDVAARIAARNRIIQFLRIEAAYPDAAPVDLECLDKARGVLVRRNTRDNPGRTPMESLLPIAPEVLELIETLASYLGETHALDKSNAHYGDDEAGHECSYCAAIDAAVELLANAKGETL